MQFLQWEDWKYLQQEQNDCNYEFKKKPNNWNLNPKESKVTKTVLVNKNSQF